jgi:Uma2 family endonuclease
VKGIAACGEAFAGQRMEETAMSVLTAPRDVLSSPQFVAGREQHFVISEVSWQAYLAIGEALRDRPALRMTYDRGTLEFMTTSPAHEKYKAWLVRLIETLAEESGLPIEPAGSMTFRRSELERGFEPDQCFWIANEAQVRGRMEWLPERDPPPDLLIEIELSRSALDRMGIFAALGCPEVWRFDGETLRVEVLQADRTYQAVERSPTFPAIPPAGIVPFVQPKEQIDYLSGIRAFRTWVRQQLAGQSSGGTGATSIP